jgi:hypothetical protein
MKWQQFPPIVVVVGAAVMLGRRSSGRKTGGCGCPGGCTRENDMDPEKGNAGR